MSADNLSFSFCQLFLFSPMEKMILVFHDYILVSRNEYPNQCLLLFWRVINLILRPEHGMFNRNRCNNARHLAPPDFERSQIPHPQRNAQHQLIGNNKLRKHNRANEGQKHRQQAATSSIEDEPGALMRHRELVDVNSLKETDVVESHPELRQPIFRDQKQLRSDITICFFLAPKIRQSGGSPA